MNAWFTVSHSLTSNPKKNFYEPVVEKNYVAETGVKWGETKPRDVHAGQSLISDRLSSDTLKTLLSDLCPSQTVSQAKLSYCINISLNIPLWNSAVYMILSENSLDLLKFRFPVRLLHDFSQPWLANLLPCSMGQVLSPISPQISFTSISYTCIVR